VPKLSVDPPGTAESIVGLRTSMSQLTKLRAGQYPRGRHQATPDNELC
jgi:hypothetical protein